MKLSKLLALNAPYYRRKPRAFAADGTPPAPTPPAGDPPAPTPPAPTPPAGDPRGAEFVPRSELERLQRDYDRLRAEAEGRAAETAARDTKIKELEERYAALGQDADPSKIMEELAALRAEKEAAALKDMDERQRLEHELKKARGEVDTLNERFTKREQELLDGATRREKELLEIVGNLRGRQLRGDIASAAAKNNAVNPDQIVSILDGKFKLDEKTGEYVFERPNKRGNIETVSVDEYVAEFLSDPVNLNLVSAKAPRKPAGAPGGAPGGRPDGKGGKDGKDDGHPLAEVQLGRDLFPHEKEEARRRGISEEEYAEELAVGARMRDLTRGKRTLDSGLLPGEVPLRTPGS